MPQINFSYVEERCIIFFFLLWKQFGMYDFAAGSSKIKQFAQQFFRLPFRDLGLLIVEVNKMNASWLILITGCVFPLKTTNAESKYY